MTIIAFANGTMYADQNHVLYPDNTVRKVVLKNKLHVNSDRTIAFCYTGLEVRSEAVNTMFYIFHRMLELDRTISRLNSNRIFEKSNIYDIALCSGNRYYIVMSSDVVIAIDTDQDMYLDKNDYYVNGSESNYFTGLYLSGMCPDDIIPFIHNNLSKSVSSTFDSFKQSDLAPLKFLDDEFEKDIVKKRIDAVID